MTAFVIISGFVVGAALGSFLGCLWHRWPRGLSLLRPPSHCVACGHTLTAAELLPLVSFLYQRGKARCCGTPLAPTYFWCELGCALLGATLAYWVFA